MHNLADIVAFRQARGKYKLVLDANLLVFLFVGYLAPEHIKDCEILFPFQEKDYRILLEILENFEPEIIITPHVLAELSNISRRRKMRLGDKKQAYFNMIIDKLKNFHEEHITLSELIGLDLNAVIKFGFSDLGIIEAAKKTKAIILSNDFEVVSHALNQNLWAINFTNVRTAGI